MGTYLPYPIKLCLNGHEQVEVSLTQVFAWPVQGRHFFEAVIRENLDLGRPDRVGLLFPALVGAHDHLPGPWRAGLDNLDAQIRTIHEAAVLAA